MRSIELLASLLAALLFLAAPAAAQLDPGAPAAAEAPAETSVAEALRLLAIVLDDADARAALVEQLRAVEPGAPVPFEPAPADRPIPELVAEGAAGAAERLAGEISQLFRGLAGIREIIANARAFEFVPAAAALGPGLLVIAAALLVHCLLRRLGRAWLARLEAQAAGEGRRTAAMAGAVLVEAVMLALAWSAGWTAALAAGGGRITPAQGLLLTAFAAVEASKIMIRFVLRPRHPGLRPFAATEATARHWAFWLARIAGFAGYGLVFLVPASEPFTSSAFTFWLQLLIVTVSAALAVVLVLRNRRCVRAAIEAQAARLRPGVLASGLAVLAQGWHLAATLYILALFVVWRADPGNAGRFIVQGTALSAAAILAGSLLLAALTRRITAGVTLSPRLRSDLPTLEARLNRSVPVVLALARLLIGLLVLAVILSVWGIADPSLWAASETGRAILARLAWVGGILLVAAAAWIVVSSWIEYRLNPDIGTLPSPRERTLLALFSNAFIILLLVMTAMLVLNELGLNIAPLLAGAGVVGLAIGFGAQKLVQDIINGAFIQVENTMNEGDVVTAGGVTGVVEKLTIRSVSLRDLQGCYHMIPFSGVESVANFMKGFSVHVAEIGVAYREDIAEVKQAMFDAFDRLMETEHRASILPPLDMQGITEFADSAVMVRARIKTLPGKQWATGRAYREVLKAVFDERGIEMPFPHRTLYLGEPKTGAAPPLNLRTLREPRIPPQEAAGPRPGAPGARPEPEVEPRAAELPDPSLSLPGSSEAT
ncbi:mechanosensitive ion channel [soil metagenome]